MSNLPWLDLESARQKANEIRKEREDAIKEYERQVRDAAEKKRAHRQAEGIALVRNLKEMGATAAMRKARLDVAQEEFEAELAAGLVIVQKEKVDQSKDDMWSLRHFSERSDAIERWSGGGTNFAGKANL